MPDPITGYIGSSQVVGPPEIVTYPTVTGANHLRGVTVTTTDGTWLNASTFTYQWKRGTESPGFTLGGETTNSYVTAILNNQSYFCEVTATGPGGSTTVQSNYYFVTDGRPYSVTPSQTFPTIANAITSTDELTNEDNSVWLDPGSLIQFSWNGWFDTDDTVIIGSKATSGSGGSSGSPIHGANGLNPGSRLAQTNNMNYPYDEFPLANDAPTLIITGTDIGDTLTVQLDNSWTQAVDFVDVQWWRSGSTVDGFPGSLSYTIEPDDREQYIYAAIRIESQADPSKTTTIFSIAEYIPA